MLINQYSDRPRNPLMSVPVLGRGLQAAKVHQDVWRKSVHVSALGRGAVILGT